MNNSNEVYIYVEPENSRDLDKGIYQNFHNGETSVSLGLSINLTDNWSKI